MNGKSEGPKLQLVALKQAESGSQVGFDKAIQASLRYCEKYEIEDVANFNYWVGLSQSFISCLAMKNGLVLPEMPSNLDALVVRRETIGLL